MAPGTRGAMCPAPFELPPLCGRNRSVHLRDAEYEVAEPAASYDVATSLDLHAAPAQDSGGPGHPEKAPGAQLAVPVTHEGVMPALAAWRRRPDLERDGETGRPAAGESSFDRSERCRNQSQYSGSAKGWEHGRTG